MLYRPGGEDLVAVATLWRARYTEMGVGTSLLVWADPGAPGSGGGVHAGIYTDNVPVADWLWRTFNRRWEPLLGRGLEQAERQPAEFVENSDGPDHRWLCRGARDTVELVWRKQQPCIWTETFPYEYRTTAAIVPCLEASILINGLAVVGEVRPHADVFARSAALAFSETWLSRD